MVTHSGKARHVVMAVIFFYGIDVSIAKTDTSVSLDEIVVTSTRIESSILDIARSITVLSKDQIQSGQQLLGLGESLARVPGLYMQNRYNFAQDLRISLRGFGARSSFGIRGVRIFVDDIPESLPDGQAQVDSIDLASTGRIEVLRGPASSLYRNAAGGVILLSSELGSSQPYREAAIAGGSYGYRHQRLKTVGHYQSIDYLFSASHTELDGYRNASQSQGTSVNTKLSFRPTSTDEFLLTFNNTDQPWAEDPGAIDIAQLSLNRRSTRAQNVQYSAGEELSQQRIGGVYKTKRFGGELMLRNYYVWRDFANRLPFTDGGAVDLERFFYGMGAQYGSSEIASGRLQFITGIDLDRQDDHRRRFDNNDSIVGDKVFDQKEVVDSSGGFLQAQFAVSKRWSLSAGLRYDELSFDVKDRYLVDGDDSGTLTFDQWSPSISASYSTDKGVGFAAWGRSFETPTTTELANPDGSGGFNPLLKAQIANSYEVGFKTSLESLFMEVAVFHIDLKNELIPFEVATAPGRTFYSNAGSSTRNGVETALSWHGGGRLSAEISYTWSDFTFSRFVQNGSDFSGNRLPGLPKHFGYLGLKYQPSSAVTLNLDTRFSGNLYAENDNSVAVGNYTVSNLRFS